MEMNKKSLQFDKPRYLKDLIPSLPTGCLFDKGKVGCGGTSLAIECNLPYIICVPFVSLVENKMKQYPNDRYDKSIFGVYKDIPKKAIKKYLESTDVPKIICTYDAIERVSELIDPSQFNLLIDEYHILFNQYSFRSDAVQKVLKSYLKYKNFTFMTATPLEPEFVLEELKYLPLVKQDWPDVLDTKVQTVKCSNVEASTIKLIKNFLNGTISGNAYIFVNSVDFIKTMINKIGLTAENTKIIYSKNNKTQLPLKNSSADSPIKKINLLTSTVFEGSDIYDPDGRTIIVSDPSKSQTLLDISTSIQQIAGRIRNSKYLGWITHLYKNTRYSEIGYDEFRQLNLTNIEESKQAVISFNALPESAKKKILNFTADTYIQIDKDHNFVYDPNMAKIDIFNYKVINGLYSIRVNLAQEYQKQGFESSEVKDKSISMDFEDTTESFRDLVLAVRKEYEQEFKLNTPMLDYACNKYK